MEESEEPETSPSNMSNNGRSYKLVPWESWNQWNFVYQNLFSSHPHNVAGWKSRGCLPTAVEVTAGLVEVQQRDPYFRKDLSSNDISSGEMLPMAYSMAIMRLVNGFVEQPHRKERLSIAEAADAIGLPRMLIDIRHECSHRELPSLQLLRLASVKAIDWLKSHYWERQSKLLPDIPKEIKSKLKDLLLCIKFKQAVAQCSPGTGGAKIPEKLIGSRKFFSRMTGKLNKSKTSGLMQLKKKTTEILKSILFHYASSPCQVASTLVDELLSKKFDDLCQTTKSDNLLIDTEQIGKLSTSISLNDWKLVTFKLSRREPGLLLLMFKDILERVDQIEALESTQDLQSIFLCQEKEHRTQTEKMASLASFILGMLKIPGDSRPHFSKCTSKSNTILLKNANVLKEELKVLLRTCLEKSARWSILFDSCFHLSQLVGSSTMTQSIKKLSEVEKSRANSTGDDTSIESEADLDTRDLVAEAMTKLEMLKQHQRGNQDKVVSIEAETWKVAKSWKPCPIGMLPSPFSSYEVLPVLEMISDASREIDVVEVGHKREGSFDVSEEDLHDNKRLKETVEEVCEEDVDVEEEINKSLLSESKEEDLPRNGGQLLIGGSWVHCDPEMLLTLQSKVRVFC